MNTQMNIMKYFGYAHLPEKMQLVSKPFCDLAKEMDKTLPEGPEKSVGLRKLLEAKDCAVRASMDIHWCSNCNSPMLETGVVTADYPPWYVYQCPRCDKEQNFR